MKTYKVKNDSGQTFEVDEDKLHEAENDGFLPLVSNGKEEHRVSRSDFHLAQQDGYIPMLAVSELRSFGGGALQGGTLGYADEAEAAGKSIFNDMYNVLTGNVTKPEVKKDEFGRYNNEDANSDVTYNANLDNVRQEYKQLQQANPNSYMAGELTGGIASSAFIPGGTVTKLGSKVLQGAALGGVTAAGYSEADNLKDLAQDTAVGATIGGFMPVAIDKVIAPGMKYVGSKLSEKIPQAIDWTTKKIGKGVFGVDEKATELYLKNPNAVNNAPQIGDIAESLLNKTDDTSVINEVQKRVSDLSSDAWNTLDKNKSLPKFEVLQAIDDVKQGLLIDGNIVGKAQQRAWNELDNLSQQLDNLNSDISEPTFKHIIQALDQNINYNNPELGPTNDALKSIRGFIDQRLKTQNPAYKDAMAKTEEATKALQQIKSVFQNRQNPDSFDKFTKSVKNVVNKDPKSAANQALDKINKHTGYDIKDDITNSWAKDQFSKGDINGSRKTVLGGIVGAAVGSVAGPMGGVVGSSVGGAVGFTADKYSGPIFKKLLDGQISAQEIQHLAPKLGKYAKPLMDAASRGPAAITATHWLLQQQDPSYRQLTEFKEE